MFYVAFMMDTFSMQRPVFGTLKALNGRDSLRTEQNGRKSSNSINLFLPRPALTLQARVLSTILCCMTCRYCVALSQFWKKLRDWRRVSSNYSNRRCSKDRAYLRSHRDRGEQVLKQQMDAALLSQRNAFLPRDICTILCQSDISTPQKTFNQNPLLMYKDLKLVEMLS